MPLECRHCGMEIMPGKACPKCEMPYSQQHRDALYEIDVAHSGETWQQAEQKILDALDICLQDHYKGLKIIHGRGSFKGSGIIRREAIRLMQYLADKHGGRFTTDQFNAGASLIYFNQKPN